MSGLFNNLALSPPAGRSTSFFLKKNGYQNKNASVEIIRCLIKFTLPEDVSRDLLFIICRPEHSHDQP
jgi:hypothetical protein